MSNEPYERPARFRLNFGRGDTGQCMHEWVFPNDDPHLVKVKFCVKRVGHDGDHEYRIEGRVQ